MSEPEKRDRSDMDADVSRPAAEVTNTQPDAVLRQPSPTRRSTSPTPPTITRSATTPTPSAVSLTASPKASRDVSPVRSTLRATLASVPRATRSRKGSQDFSPNRSNSSPISHLPSVPSAAAIQRALSVAGTPQLPPPTSPGTTADTEKLHRAGREASGTTAQGGKQTPRLKSPPPTLKSPPPTNKDVSQRRTESAPATPSIVVERSTPTSTIDRNEFVEKAAPKSAPKAPRGASGATTTLETVQETPSIQPTASGRGPPKDSDGRSGIPEPDARDEGSGQQETSDPPDQTEKMERSERPERIDEDPTGEALAQETRSFTTTGTGTGTGTSTGSDSSEHTHSKRSSLKDGTKPAASHSSKPQVIRSKRSFTQLLPSKAKGPEAATKGMTVEAETVSTVPQVALGVATGERTAPGRTETAGSLRLKPSNETIRPKKERKKAVRKAPSINAGNASSKADIFEQKVATAIDQTNSSDSEETFVYESNPPEPLSARPYRFHSRTPSATSVISQYDQYGGRLRSDGGHTVAGKKSMKFATNSFHVDAGDPGTVRGPGQSRMTSNPAQHHHLGRFGRPGNGHTSIFDSDSPFPTAAKALRTPTTHVARLSSRPSSPRSPQVLRMVGTPKHAGDAHGYDLDGDGADDERTPLIGTVRSTRGRHGRRPLTGPLRPGYVILDKDRHRYRRIATYAIMGTLLVLLAAATVMVLLLCSKPLVEIYVKDIRNVLASEQELMLDLHVRATNPNIIAVQVSDLDVNIFAKSKHVGSGAVRRARRLPRGARSDPPSGPVRGWGGVDEGTDPIDDPETDSSTMLLGRVFEFDSPLIFEPSPMHRQSLSSVGEVSLAQPGNRTEEGGSDRWERVLLHDFELIVRGVLRYSLPISSKTRSVSIGSSIIVHPTDDVLADGAMVISRPPPRPRPDAGSNVELRPVRGDVGSAGVSG